MRWIFSGLSETASDNIAMLGGMVLFVGLNYLGQRFFAFKDAGKEDENGGDKGVFSFQDSEKGEAGDGTNKAQ